MNVLARIGASAQRFAERTALFARGESFTYGELIATARGIRACLEDRGCGPGARVAVVTGDDLHTYSSMLAIWSAGAAYVPLNVNNPADRNGQIIQDAELELVLTSRPEAEWSGHLPVDLDTGSVIRTGNIEPNEGTLPLPATQPDDVAYIFFTSGSTGKPKGVPITHANLEAFMTTLIDDLGYEFAPEDRFLQMFELTFDLSVMAVFAPWCVGASTYVVPEKGIAYMNILDLLMKKKISVALMVPSLLPYLQRFFDEIRLPDLRLSLFCGEALTHDIVTQWSRCLPNGRIENVYGPTEATIFCTTYPWSEDRSAQEQVNGIVPIGKQMPRTTTAVVSSDGKVLPDGEKGELCLLGDQVMTGYWRNEEKTRQAFVEVELDGVSFRAYRTGDICYVNDRGNLIYCGRMDSQVKIEGHRIELGEIEYYARKFIKSSKSAVVVKRDVSGQDYLVLFIGADELDREALENFLRVKLPDYMCPRQIVVLRDLPLNLNGKIDRVALSKLNE
jgi:amino acid adenylation domain-containing protein